MKILLCYDLSGSQDQVKNLLESDYGFTSIIDKSGEMHNLPQSTLYHPDLPDTNAAIKKLDEALKKINGHNRANERVKRVIASEATINSSRIGESHA